MVAGTFPSEERETPGPLLFMCGVVDTVDDSGIGEHVEKSGGGREVSAAI